MRQQQVTRHTGIKRGREPRGVRGAGSRERSGDLVGQELDDAPRGGEIIAKAIVVVDEVAW